MQSNLTEKFSKEQIATAVAIIFHCVGLIGILSIKSDFFMHTTPLNLLLMFGLLIWTQKEKNTPFFIFLAATFLIGFFTEVIGVNTQLLFGNYSYGTVLGWKWMGVPLLLGANWFIIIYCSGVSTQTLLMKTINSVAIDTEKPPMILKALSVIIDGATLAVLFDWLMEPVAIKLGFWSWQDNAHIPIYNYVCWFVISAGILTIFHFCKFDKQNKFAVNLLLIQAMFFLILRTFL